MGILPLLSYFYSFCILSTFCLTNFTLVHSHCQEDQKTLLRELKAGLAFNSSVSTKLVQWNQTQDCCSWYGVECDGAGRVISLHLDYEGISGGIQNLSSLFSLTHLEKLNLAYNHFENAQIPMMIHNLTHLTHLNLSNAGFGGQVPFELSLMWRLVSLDLSTKFYTSTPLRTEYPNLKMLLQNLTGLRELHLDGVDISAILVPNLFTNFTSLTTLTLSSCSLQGLFPEMIFQVPTLQYIDLSSNNLTGSISISSVHLKGPSNLVYINLQHNSLYGSIPRSLFGLPSLRKLLLSNNQFSGLVNEDVHGFPNSLTFLDISKNMIEGEIPSWILEIGAVSHLNLSFNLLTGLQKPYRFSNSLHVLDLKSNQIRGDLPMPPVRARYVDYSSNYIENRIPHNIGNFTSHLSFFSLANNSLSGTIPTSLCNSTNLKVLDLSQNYLSGNIPPCLLKDMENLEVLNLRMNNISGNIPDTCSVNCGLKTLDLSRNNLQRNIPLSLANCKLLEVLNVGHNNMNGSFPCMLPSNLHVLVLRGNRFHGEVKCHKSWPNLQVVDIASNNFGGLLYPRIFLSWKGMMREDEAQLRHDHLRFEFLGLTNLYYRDDVTLPIKGLSVELVRILTVFPSIDFSCNNFRGEIPNAIGDLLALYVLNLSRNSLTGTIPESIGSLSLIGSLDLSSNQLTGEIPKELTNLTFLSFLNLSYNKLVGMIPIGSQFQTFSAESYEGNVGLCGFPLDELCTNMDENGARPPPEMRSYQETGIEWEYVSGALGFVVGLGSVIWLIFGCRSVNKKFSEQVERVVAKIFDEKDGKRRRRQRVPKNQVIRKRN